MVPVPQVALHGPESAHSLQAPSTLEVIGENSTYYRYIFYIFYMYFYTKYVRCTILFSTVFAQFCTFFRLPTWTHCNARVALDRLGVVAEAIGPGAHGQRGVAPGGGSGCQVFRLR